MAVSTRGNRKLVSIKADEVFSNSFPKRCLITDEKEIYVDPKNKDKKANTINKKNSIGTYVFLVFKLSLSA